MDIRWYKTIKERRWALEKERKIKLNIIGKSLGESEEKLIGENLVGATILPLGVAGPLKVKSSKFKVKSYYIPLATTEGALIASVNRGCKVINLSGEAKVFVNRVGVTRGPVYFSGSLKKGFWFKKWLIKNFIKIKKKAESTSSHLQLTKQEVKIIGAYTYVRFYFDSQDAMGMNMATMAVDEVNRLIESETKIKCISLSGNFCIDKKPAWLNLIQGRGNEVWAETTLKEEIIKKHLKTTAKKIYQVWLAKDMIGSAISGSIGFNSHFANIVSAFFTATGQDLAHIVEGSLGITVLQPKGEGDLYFSIYMPAVMVGMVGGGTGLAVKKEALSIVGAKNSEELAEVLAGAVLAGEISLLASLAEGSLAEAHQRLGR